MEVPVYTESDREVQNGDSGLKEKGPRYTLVEYPGYIHEWPVWRVTLKDLLPRLFQSASK